ncbi:MAG TPA: ATP-binding protein [Conexivisphaerales archaeon]|nr:ATP-binding protein [Conexivisphaerales archaeon]
MKVVATGISGAGRGSYLSQVAELARANGRSVHVFETGDMMFETAEKLGVNIPADKILDLSPSTLNFLRTTVFERIIRESKEVEDTIISTHACFRWKKHIIQAFDFHYLDQIRPDVYLSVIDSVTTVRARQEEMPQWKGQLSMKDIMVWRDEEVFVTKSIADFQRRPFYMIPREEPPETLYGLLYSPRAPKAYLSYPMTHTLSDVDDMKKKDVFKERLRTAGLVVFDPVSIGDGELLTLLDEAKAKGVDSITYEKVGSSVSIGLKEAEEVSEDVSDQIVARDYQLIDQSDLIVVYYFLPVMSPGVLSEMSYGYTNKKDVYALFAGQESPFFKYYSTKIFHSEDDMVEFLSRRTDGQLRSR